MNSFLKVLKIESVQSFLYMRPWFLNFFCCLVMEKIHVEDNVWLASMKTLTTCENPSSNPLQHAFCSIQEVACDPVIFNKKKYSSRDTDPLRPKFFQLQPTPRINTETG
jgi:hypothetical protein